MTLRVRGSSPIFSPAPVEDLGAPKAIETSSHEPPISHAKTGLPASPLAPSPLLDPFHLPTDAASAAIAGVHVGHWNRVGAKIVTASDVDPLLEELPPPLRALASQLRAALGHEGPLGSHGPLGRLGPVSDEPWSPSFWMQKTGGFEASLDGAAPGGELGPLGQLGPLERQALLDAGLLAELKGGGVFAPLGPLGPLGALGALGYLGLVGGHGFARDDDGHFVDSEGARVKTAPVMIDGVKKEMELVELYSEPVAKKARIHDASWIIKGGLTPDEVDDRYRFTVKKGQVVTLAVVPEKNGENLEIELVRKGKVLARSSSTELVNWIHFEAESSGPLEVRVKRSQAEAKTPGAVSAYIDWVLSPLVMWGEAVRPWVGAKPKAEGVGYRLCAVTTPAE